MRKKISPATIRKFGGKSYHILTRRPMMKSIASSIAKFYRKKGAAARIVKTKDGYVVFVRQM